MATVKTKRLKGIEICLSYAKNTVKGIKFQKCRVNVFFDDKKIAIN